MLKSRYSNILYEAGCDEAGRGCLAGPVVAASVIFPVDYVNPLINDSKKLSVSKRDYLCREIERDSVCWAIGIADNNEIDRFNILNASVMAMHRAISQLVQYPGFIIVDGNRFHSYQDIPHHCIIKGDSLFLSIAAASILAKTHRDRIILEHHYDYPVYGWDRNKGYPTKFHARAINEFGLSEYHRKSFKLKNRQLNIDFRD